MSFVRHQLPHRTGTHDETLRQDDVVLKTRDTLVKLSASSVAIILDSLVALLGDLARPYASLAAHPPHVLLSELYVLGLMADCCTSHWYAAWPHDDAVPLPESLDDALVQRIFETVRIFLPPLPEKYVLPSSTILDDEKTRGPWAPSPAFELPRTPMSQLSDSDMGSGGVLDGRAAEIESSIKAIIEYATASSWSSAFDYFRTMVYAIRTSASAQISTPSASPTLSDEDRVALVVLRMVSYFWVDKQKLGQVIQELCSSFLHFKRPLQNTVAMAAPLLILRWVSRYPLEFVDLHTLPSRVDGGPETLFEMTQAVGENGRRRGLLYPLQATLLLLLPDVFEVASNLREAKSASMAKKTAFLDILRKAMRNRNEPAAYCLVSLLRAARHFDAESDSALMSYAMDVQDEVKDAVFRRMPLSSAAPDSSLDQDVLTAAFVSLVHLSSDSYASSLAEECLAESAPQPFKVAVIQGCSYFARLPDALRYDYLFAVACHFVQEQLKVSHPLVKFPSLPQKDKRPLISPS